MQGLGVSVDNFHSDALIAIFETNIHEGQLVPFVEWNSSQVVDLQGHPNFILTSNPPTNDREFPTYVNSKTGTNSNVPDNFQQNQYTIAKRVKYYRVTMKTVSIRLYKVTSSESAITKYIYHYQVKSTQDRPPRQTSNEQQIINPGAPQITGLTPNLINYEIGKKEMIEVSGINLCPIEGFLNPRNSGAISEVSIPLTIFVTPGGGFRAMFFTFHHPVHLVDNYYYPVFRCNDNFVYFNQWFIQFAVLEIPRQMWTNPVSQNIDSMLSPPLLNFLFQNEQVMPNPAVNHNAACNGCDTVMPGIRYKCTVCENLYLCESCQHTSGPYHDLSHPMWKITVPISHDQNSLTNNIYFGT